MISRNWKEYPDHGFQANKIYRCIKNAEKKGYPNEFNLARGFIIRKSVNKYANRWYVEGPSGCKSYDYPIWYIHDVLDLFETCEREENSISRLV